ncbi:unnamed protein product [Blepharisma stoltei]|uniref:Uncharacterized protein n=1 Tax=Blepharisma stoltei TaxID=1481888 RepID=A0AAU9JDY6_9CILI|nr:unnamed protein product [Blepharisma stoltei]
MSQDNHSFQENLENLQTQIRECEQAFKFAEAEQLKQQMIRLTNNESASRIQNTKTSHEAEQMEIEDNHLMEFQNINNAWEARIKEQRDYADQEINSMMSKHERDKVQEEAKLESLIPLKPKYSSELLNMIKIEEGLVRQKSYGEAHSVQQRISMLMMRENENWEKERKRKIKQHITHLENKQAIELQALRTRLRCAEDELNKSRIVELETLLQKYHNIKKDLHNYQVQEINRLKATKTLI